jgi:hypothetical protein
MDLVEYQSFTIRKIFTPQWAYYTILNAVLHIAIAILDFSLHPSFILKHDVSETELCPRLPV